MTWIFLLSPSDAGRLHAAVQNPKESQSRGASYPKELCHHQLIETVLADSQCDFVGLHTPSISLPPIAYKHSNSRCQIHFQIEQSFLEDALIFMISKQRLSKICFIFKRLWERCPHITTLSTAIVQSHMAFFSKVLEKDAVNFAWGKAVVQWQSSCFAYKSSRHNPGHLQMCLKLCKSPASL